MLKKEAQGGEEYKQWKQARAERRVMGRLTDVAAAVVEGVTEAGMAAAFGVLPDPSRW